MKNAEQQQNQRRFQCQQKGWYLTGWHKPELCAQVLTSAVTLTSCQDIDTEWLQLELLHHRPVPLYFWTYFPIPQFLRIFDTEREVSECGVRTDKFTEIRTSGGHHPEQKTKTWWIQDRANQMSANGGCSRPKKSLKYFPRFGLEAGAFCICHTRRNSVGIRQRPDIEVGDTFLVIFGLLEDSRGLQRRTYFHL